MDLSEEIQRLTDELISRCLLEVAKKYKLPLEKFDLSAVAIASKKVDTDFYTLTVSPDIHAVLIKWHLKQDAIDAKLNSIRGKEKMWKFFGFVKETAFKASAIKTHDDLINSADISSTTSGQLSFNLTPLVRYPASFLVMFESRSELILDGEVSVMIQQPETPRLEDISALKEKLRHLVRDVEPASPQSLSEIDIVRERFVKAAEQIAAFKKQLADVGFSEEEIENGAADLKERLDQLLFN